MADVHIKSSDSSPRTRDIAGSESNHMPGSTPSKEPDNIEEHMYTGQVVFILFISAICSKRDIKP